MTPTTGWASRAGGRALPLARVADRITCPSGPSHLGAGNSR